MNSNHRITVTPDVVQILLSKAFQQKKKKSSETGQELSLSQAKLQVARDYGFRDWQHLKDLERKFKLQRTIKQCDDNVTFEGDVSIDEYEGVKRFSMGIEEVTHDENCEDLSRKSIGSLHGYIWDENKDEDIFWYLDRISDDLADFARLFKEHRETIEYDFDCAWISKIAFIEDLYIDPAYDEEYIAKAALKTFYNRLGSLVDALFCQPVPRVYLKLNECAYALDKARIREYEKIFEDAGFERLFKSDFSGRSNSQNKGKMSSQTPLEELRWIK